MPYIRITPDAEIFVGNLADGKTVADIIDAFIGSEVGEIQYNEFIDEVSDEIPNIVMIYDKSFSAATALPRNLLATDLLLCCYCSGKGRYANIFGDCLIFKYGASPSGKKAIVELSDDDLAVIETVLGVEQ